MKKLIHKNTLNTSGIILSFISMIWCNSTLAAQNNIQLLAAYEGNPEAQFQLALTYSKQTPNNKLAAYWYKQAARQGMADAQYNLGHFYLQGLGVEQSTTETIKWWQQAAHQDYAPAQHNLGTAYFEGIGVEKNDHIAEQWFLRCSKLGNEACAESLQIVRSNTDVATQPAKQTEPSAKQSVTSAKLTEPSAKQTVTSAKQTVTSAKQSVTSAKQTEPTVETSAKTTTAKLQPKKISIHINANATSSVIAELENPDDIAVLNTTDDWQQVQLKQPIAVWCYKAYVSIENSIGTLTGDKVRARTAPSINDSKIITELSIGSKLKVLAEEGKWVKLALKDHVAWTPFVPKTNPAPQTQENTDSAQQNIATVVNQDSTEQTKPSATIKALKALSFQYSFLDRRSDDEWLFASNPAQFTVLLGNYDNSKDLTQFAQKNQLLKQKLAHLLLAKRGKIEWKYVLYGNFDSSEDAISAVQNNGFANAYVANIGNIQEQRCSAWKTTIPSPKKLDTYCLKKTTSNS